MQCADACAEPAWRIAAADHVNITQFYPCIDHVSVPPYVNEISDFLQPHRKLSRLPSYSTLSCAPANKNLCFRGVCDGFNDLVDNAHKVIGQQEGDALLGDYLYDRIALLLENIILYQNATLPTLELEDGEESKPTMLAPSTKRYRVYAPNRMMGNFEDMHADYYESEGFVYTAILYDEPPDDLLGGETAIVDFWEKVESFPTVNNNTVSFGLKYNENEVDPAVHFKRYHSRLNRIKHPPLHFTSGLIVEPKRGRLLLFSGDGSNFHHPMEVKRGRRPTFHIWYRCK